MNDLFDKIYNTLPGARSVHENRGLEALLDYMHDMYLLKCLELEDVIRRQPPTVIREDSE